MQEPQISLFRRISNHFTGNGAGKSLLGIFYALLKDLNYVLRSVWLFFPPILFLIISYAVFWQLSQGQDILVSVFEKKWTFIQFVSTHALWVFMTWYTSRILSYAKQNKTPAYLPPFLFTHIPRFLGFTCYTLVILAFFRISNFPSFRVPGGYAIFVLISLPYYVIWSYLAGKLQYGNVWRFSLIVVFVFLLLVSVGYLRFRTYSIITVLILIQICFVFFVVGRRKLIASNAVISASRKNGISTMFIDRISIFFSVPEGERVVFIIFNITSFVFAIFYLACFLRLEVALLVRTCSFIFLAFAFLVGIMNIISFLSVKYSISFHIILIAMAFLTSKVESYRVRLPEKDPAGVSFDKRQDLNEYFNNWVKQREKELRDPNAKTYPVFFVLANGGASRSGYWVASVLSALEDSSKSEFSHHLFCLSGASGGSLGNATFFSLLKYKKELAASGKTNLGASREYLHSDFLTFTLANMLGPDYFRHLYPIPFFHSNRANALITSMERAPADSVFLKGKLADPFSLLATREKEENYHLPVLFINTTRMQDGRPSVISNIRISETIFNRRVDVLDLLDSSQDMKLSTAVELGASFPYVSPANRIDHLTPEGNLEVSYFVDGGYFDNSGAGVVHEAIMQLQQIMRDSTNSLAFPYRDKLQFFVIHILNDAITTTNLNPVSPIQNDLAAPLKTLAGSYGTQTSTNDLRLKKFLQFTYNNSDDHYIPVNLYKPNDSIVFSMNWVISQRTLDRMDQRLSENKQVPAILQILKRNPAPATYK